eukprot:CAMPEP_0181130624 /NCGR_PEP_ID=MMETSP1071-20121207/29969_1 /TAXON_ID=35127 /ORGANISM="Thalassiosira sp., Strain NH16" /LENGTH=2952 /DNA_ID=CAMNT_0023216719 /DNA_START=277 /DNA_END=9135 /DNA_ORIENTATION=-
MASQLEEVANVHHAMASQAEEVANNIAASIASSGSGIPSTGSVATEAPPDTLKVAVLGASRGKAPDCTYSLVEFSNTHHTDAIVVYSTYIEPMAVFPPDVGHSNPSTSINDMPFSSLFHGEDYQDRQLQVPPRTAVTIPVSIIPHLRKPPDLNFRHRQHARYRKIDSKEGTPAPLSSPTGQDNLSLFDFIDNANGTLNHAIHADLFDMIENARKESSHTSLPDSVRRSQLLDASTIHETLIANTSLGFVQVKVPYTCSPQHSKEYEFGLPNNLMFLDGGGGWYARRNTTPTVELAYLFGDWEFNPARDVLDPFIYRVYMNNPLPDKSMKIWNVYTTKPNLAGVEIQSRFDTSTNIHSSKNDASLHFPFKEYPYQAKKNNIYVVTLRLYPQNFTEFMTHNLQDLGFLEIHTNIGRFSIALDYIPNGGREGVIHGVGENKTTLHSVHLVQDHIMHGLLSTDLVDLNLKKHAPPMIITKSYHAKDSDEKNTTAEGGLKYLGKMKLTKAKETDQNIIQTSLLKANPSQIKFGSVSTGLRTIRVPLTLSNIHQTKPLRVMRISVAMSMLSDNGAGNVTNISGENLWMEIGVDFPDGTSMTLLSTDGNSSSGDDARNRCDDGCNDRDTTRQSKGKNSKEKETFIFSQDIVLPPGDFVSGHYEYPIQVWCRFNAASPEGNSETGGGNHKAFGAGMETENILQLARFYTGTIVFRASEDLMLTYRDWEHQFLSQHSAEGWRRGLSEIPDLYVLEVPFSGSVLPGNLGSPTESLLFPTHFFALPKEERVKIIMQQKSSPDSKIPEHYERHLDITNNFAVPLAIVGMKILDSNGDDDFCKQRFSTVIQSFPPVAEPGEKWRTLSVRYHFHNDDDHFYGGDRKCILSIETDRAGKQSLPLIIYTGELIIDMEQPEGGQLTVRCLVTKNDGTTVVSKSGMPCMNDWITATREGKALKKAILKMQLDMFGREGSFKKIGRKACTGNPNGAVISERLASSRSGGTSTIDPVESYFRSLLSKSKLNGDKALQPTVLSFGAIPTGQRMTRSILFTNLNHAPIEVMATSAAIGNTNIQIGIVPVSSGSLHDVFTALLATHGPTNKTDLAYFLHHSGKAQKFFEKFKHKFDVSPSPRAQRSELMSLFKSQSIIDAFENATEYLADYVGEEENIMECTRGFMLAVDGSTSDNSQGTYKKEIKFRKVGKKKWTIPPGGVARFWVTVQAPTREELQDDITSIVGSGLVLETNHGQAMPIILTYYAISGNLQLKPDDFSDVIVDVKRKNKAGSTVEERQQSNVGDMIEQSTAAAIADPPNEIRVPLTFKDATLTPSVDSYAQRNGVSLSIESTFSHDVYLSEIRSCSKWFNVFLPSNNSAAREFFSKQGSNAYLRIKGKRKDGHEGSSLASLTQGYSEHSSNKTVLPLGKVLSALSCSHPSGDTSFYACALAWLENRDAIQPPGCGLSEMEIVNSLGRDASITTLEERVSKAKANAIAALRDVVAFLSARYGETTDKDAASSPKTSSGSESSKGGPVHFSRIHMFDHARKMWNEIVSWQLNSITGHINAKTMYFVEPNADAQSPLQIPVSNVLLKSKLEMPKLFWGNTEKDSQGDDVGIVDFDAVHVADTAIRYVSLSNPTAMTIRVRLAAIDSLDGHDDFPQKNVFVQGSSEATHSWWTGGSYWMSDTDGNLISASHNVTIKSGAGAYVSLLNPALHTMNAFVLGCGKRCGLRGDQDASGEEKQYSPLGAASGSGSELFGRSHDQSASSQQSEKKSPKKSLGINDPPSFSLGRIGNEIVLPPYGTAELGPVYFRPPGRGSYKGTIYVENSLTGFEKVELRGRGGWENLVFLDPLPVSEDFEASDGGGGGNVEFRFGKSALVFPGSNSKEANHGNGGPVVKSVRLKNTGDVSVDVTKIYMASSEVMHFTHKRRHPSTLSSYAFRNIDHNSSEDVQDSTRKCQERGFVLPGCVDPSFTSWIDDLFSWFSSTVDNIVEKIFLRTQSSDQHIQSTRKKYAEEVESFYKNGFTLEPNQTQTMHVLHYPDCTFQTSYASIIFEIGGRTNQAPASRNARVGSWQQTFRKRKAELLVGYDMSASEYRHCTPYAPPESSMSIWEQKIVFHIPVLLQDLMSFGLTRLKDGNGNPYIPRRPIEVTLVAASFILLLFALSLDLICTVEISAIRKSCPSWKPTCRCLARADPTSSDLVSIGKDQTKHVLLSRFKKEGVLPSHCVHSDGSLSREKVGLNGSGGGSSGTHSEAIFDRLNLVNESMMKEDVEDENTVSLGLLPCGLGWRTAMRRGVGLPSSPKNGATELQYLARTRDRYVKKQRERQQREITKPALPSAFHDVSPSHRAPKVAATFNGHSPHVATTAKLTRTATEAAGAAQAAPQSKDKKVTKQSPQQVKKMIQTTNSSSNGSNGLATTSRPDPQSKHSNVSSTVYSRTTDSNINKANISSDNQATKNSFSTVAKISKNVKGKNAGAASPYVIVGPAYRKTANTAADNTEGVKQKQKQQRNETKTECTKRSATKKGIPKQEDPSPKPGKSTASQKQTRSAKQPVVENSTSNSKQEEKALDISSPSRKESAAATQTKQTRPIRKATNGSKSAEQLQKGGKQGKQKTTSKKATSKNPPTEKLSNAKKQAQSVAEFPPLSSAIAKSPISNSRTKQQTLARQPIKSNVRRPPPGLLAPPGFLEQPDHEGLSTPSSPGVPSLQRNVSGSSHNDSSVYPPSMPLTHSGGVSGLDAIPSVPLNNDLMSLIGVSACSDNASLGSPLFQAIEDSSPRASSEGSISIPPFRPQSFTPPVLEPSPTPETNNGGRPPTDVQALLGAGSNFNVSNFLDGILSDSSTHKPAPIITPKPAPQASKPVPFQSNIIGISLDPWNNIDNSTGNNNNQSNPLAVLQGATVNHHQESPVIAGIPLNNSNAPSLLGSTSTTNTTHAEPAYASLVVSDDGGDGSEFLEPDSFYNQLLGEDL